MTFYPLPPRRKKLSFCKPICSSFYYAFFSIVFFWRRKPNKFAQKYHEGERYSRGKGNREQPHVVELELPCLLSNGRRPRLPSVTLRPPPLQNGAYLGLHEALSAEASLLLNVRDAQVHGDVFAVDPDRTNFNAQEVALGVLLPESVDHLREYSRRLQDH